MLHSFGEHRDGGVRIMDGWAKFIENYLLLRKNMDCMNKPSFDGQIKCILKTNKPKKKKKRAKRR